MLADRSVANYARFTDQHGVRHELLLGYDLDPLKAEQMLEHIRADVERGVWRPPESLVSVEVEDPSFWEFASDWWASKRKQELAERSEEWYEWALKQHLLPYAHDQRISAFDSPQAIEGVRDHLLDKRWPSDAKLCPHGKQPGSKRLSARSVNQVLSVLSAILESASERGHLSKNWAATKGKRAKVKKRAKVGNWVDYEPLVALLDAAHEIDVAGPRADTRNTGRRALLACLFLGAMGGSFLDSLGSPVSDVPMRCQFVASTCSRTTVSAVQADRFDLLWQGRTCPLFELPVRDGGHRSQSTPRSRLRRREERRGRAVVPFSGSSPVVIS